MRRDLATARSIRKQKVLEAIENNAGIQLDKLCNGMSLQLEISAAKIMEYVKELEGGGLIKVDLFKAYPKGKEPKIDYSRLAPTDDEVHR